MSKKWLILSSVLLLAALIFLMTLETGKKSAPAESLSLPEAPLNTLILPKKASEICPYASSTAEFDPNSPACTAVPDPSLSEDFPSLFAEPGSSAVKDKPFLFSEPEQNSGTFFWPNLSSETLFSDTLFVESNSQIQDPISSFLDSSQKFMGNVLNTSVFQTQGITVPAENSFLSDEEVFKKIWPDVYRKYLTDTQNLVILDGTLAAGAENVFVDRGLDEVQEESAPNFNWAIPDAQRITSFSTDEDIYKAYEVILDQAYKQGYITETDYRNFQKGLREILPALVEEEKRFIRQGEPQSLILPGGQQLAAAGNTREAVMDILDGLKYVFFVAEPANAAWVRSPDCYKDDDPGNQILGFNGSTFCCNCGLRHRSRCRWRFVNDCGTNGSGCDIQLGCLNKVCGGKPNAIWDPASGICGCG